MAFPLTKGQITALVTQALSAYDESMLPYHERNTVAPEEYKTRVAHTDEACVVMILRRR